MDKKQVKQALKFIKKNKIIRTSEFEGAGFSRVYLRRLLDEGVISKISRGVYKMSDFSPSEFYSFAEASKKVPNGVICLLSSLNFFNLTNEFPFEVWIAIKAKAWKPVKCEIPIRFIRYSKSSFNEGIEIHNIDGIEVKIFSPAKTVADCFKFRHRIGLDVAISALYECRKQNKASIDQIWYYANKCRITNVIRPYLESLNEFS